MDFLVHAELFYSSICKPTMLNSGDNNLAFFVHVFTTSWLAWRDAVYLENFNFSDCPKWYDSPYPQFYFLLYFRAWPPWISTLHMLVYSWVSFLLHTKIFRSQGTMWGPDKIRGNCRVVWLQWWKQSEHKQTLLWGRKATVLFLGAIHKDNIKPAFFPRTDFT